ncbi:arginase family protein [Leucobacter chromiireducens]|uniref:Arginase family protein n=1 Tax=Leucobacter chromiireducens subsp. chromiireducens TaxID=660067 RepID=A0ABS1SP18_9MICO|nr:arginase family protein [Leucobacter chromiireducens]MBL3689911.1 arginase family protein [Leucobacter chromiireducens subsp. chromiireducens]
MSASARSFELIGAPFDGASTLGFPGSRFAPERIRHALGWITQRVEDGRVFSLETGELHAAPVIHDGGDAAVVAHDLMTTLARTSERVSESVRAGHVPILLGGDDCFLFAGTQGLHDATSGSVAVIHFDAHLDVMDENVQQGTHSQSSGMRRSLELPRASTEHSIQVGLRHFNFPSSHDYLADSGLARITAAEFAEIGTERAIARILERIAGAEHVHLSFDIDAIDPAHAPGAGALEPGGITSRQAIDTIAALAPHCDSFAVTEVNPMTDHQDMTATLAAYLCYYFAVFGQEAAAK